MRFAIIAAGDGSRLAAEGLGVPKPLVRIEGMPMIGRLTRMFVSHGADRVAVIVNPRQPETVAFMRDLSKTLPVDLVVEDTPTPMHSLHALAPYLQGVPFCATTVDTVFRDDSLAGLIKAFEGSDFDGMMGVTGLVDDEKPLYVRTERDMTISAFLDEKADCRFVSAGVYALAPAALDVLARAVGEGEKRMRHFQRRLLDNGMRLKAFDMGQVIDVDHVADIEAARRMLL